MKGSVLRKVKTERLRTLYRKLRGRITDSVQYPSGIELLDSLRVERTRSIGAGVGSAPVVQWCRPSPTDDLVGGDAHSPRWLRSIRGVNPVVRSILIPATAADERRETVSRCPSTHPASWFALERPSVPPSQQQMNAKRPIQIRIMQSIWSRPAPETVYLA